MNLSPATPSRRGEMIDIGQGRRLHLVRAGARDANGPTVLLEAGSFGFSADWAAVQERLAARAVRSLAYDRAGLGFSDRGPAPRDGLAIVRDLEALLAALGEDGPFIVCGHSMAGLHTHLFAARNPARVAGVVLVDAATPNSMNSRRVSAAVVQFGRATRLAAWGAEAGLFKPLAATHFGDKIGLGGAAKGEKRWAFALGRHNRWAAQEVAHWSATASQARQAGDMDPAWPVAVVLAGAPHEMAWLKALQIAPARASWRGVIVHVSAASHASILGERHAAEVVSAIEWVAAEAAKARP